MSTKRILKALAVVAVMLSVAALPAIAESELDQSQTPVQAGTPVAWGYNGQYQTDVPSGLTDVVEVDAGAYHNLAIKSDGTVVAWATTSLARPTCLAASQTWSTWLRALTTAWR